MSPEENRPPLAPSDFAKILLNQVVGNSENPNNLSSANVLQLVRQGVSKPEFMQEYLKSEYSIGGNPPQYSVLSDSEYMEAYRTDQVPDTRDMEERPDNDSSIPPDNDPSQPTPPDNYSLPYDPQPQPIPAEIPQPLPTQGSSPFQPFQPSQPSLPTGQPLPSVPPGFSSPPTMGLPPMTPPVGYGPPPMSPGMGLPPIMGPPPMVPSENLLQGDFGGSLPMYGSPPTQQGYNYNPSVMAELLQQVMSKQT
tara:strand:- start:1259 stop:2011 length:753 start_codon:yes stop_codon:yes gene_type:complete